jgi:hypothetical protein
MLALQNTSRRWVHLYPGVWSGFGEIHFNKQEFSERLRAVRPAYVSIDISWGPVIAPYLIDTPEHLKMTADLIRKYPDRFLYGSDQGATADWKVVRKSYDVWAPLWKDLGPALTQRITRDNYVRIFDASRKNMRAWEMAHPEKVD